MSGAGWLEGLSTAQLAGLVGGVVVLGLLAAAQVAQGLFFAHLLRQNGRLLARIEALEERTLRQAQEQIMSRTPRDTWHLWSRVGAPAGADVARNAS